MKTRRDLLHGIAAVAGAAALPGFTGAASAQALPLTVLVSPTVDAAPFYYAHKNGMFEKGGLALTYTPISSGNLAIQAVVAGSAQIGISNSLSLAQAHAHGIPVEVVSGAGLYNADIPVARIFVASDSTIRQAKDLEGHTFAISGLHDLLALSVKAWLASHGADGSKVNFVELSQAQMLPALQQKRVDAIGQFEPFATAATASGDAKSIGTPYDAISRQFNVTLWFGYQPWIGAHRDIASRFVRVMQAATGYANAHISDMAPYVASYTGMTVEVASKAMRNKTAPSPIPGQLQPVIDSAAKYGELAASFPAREMIANPPL